MNDCPENARRERARRKNLKRGGNLEIEELQEVMQVEDALVSLGQILSIIQKELRSLQRMDSGQRSLKSFATTRSERRTDPDKAEIRPATA